MEDKRPAKENEYNIGYNSGYTDNEKSQNQTTEDQKKVDNKKSLRK